MLRRLYLGLRLVIMTQIMSKDFVIVELTNLMKLIMFYRNLMINAVLNAFMI